MVSVTVRGQSYSNYAPLRYITMEKWKIVRPLEPPDGVKCPAEKDEVLKVSESVVELIKKKISREYNSKYKADSKVDAVVVDKSKAKALKRGIERMNQLVAALHEDCWGETPRFGGWSVHVHVPKISEFKAGALNKLSLVVLKASLATILRHVGERRLFRTVLDLAPVTIKVVPVKGFEDPFVLLTTGERRKNVTVYVLVDADSSTSEVATALLHSLIASVVGPRKVWDQRAAMEALTAFAKASEEVSNKAPRALANLAYDEVVRWGLSPNNFSSALTNASRDVKMDRNELLGELLSFSFSSLNSTLDELADGKLSSRYAFLIAHYMPPVG
ncbi:MAG: hypothetical protein GXO07_02725 [Crenarchaeota archaeon]|nr:hypothetical protein [Thermoproteota archaeon]